MAAFIARGPLTDGVKKILGEKLLNRTLKYELKAPADGPRVLVVEFYLNEEELLKGELDNG